MSGIPRHASGRATHFGLDHLRGTLPEGYDSTAFHLNPDMRSAIERGSAAMAALLEADARG